MSILFDHIRRWVLAFTVHSCKLPKCTELKNAFICGELRLYWTRFRQIVDGGKLSLNYFIATSKLEIYHKIYEAMNGYWLTNKNTSNQTAEHDLWEVAAIGCSDKPKMDCIEPPTLMFPNELYPKSLGFTPWNTRDRFLERAAKNRLLGFRRAVPKSTWVF